VAAFPRDKTRGLRDARLRGVGRRTRERVARGVELTTVVASHVPLATAVRVSYPAESRSSIHTMTMSGCEDLCCTILAVSPLVIILWKVLWHARAAQKKPKRPPPEKKLGRRTVHPACLALGIPRLRRVPIFVRKLVHGMRNTSWQRGHYPYATCPVSGPSGSASPTSVATLLVADHQYTEVIPRWAAGSHAANVDLCVVGQVGASNLPCQAARHVGCECMSHNHASAVIGRNDSSFARAGARGRSVRYRFEYAQALLARNYSVLMLDADVFLHDAGMAKLLSFLRTGVVGYDFALMDNHARREAYDDLNWGVAWMSPSETSKRLLSCLLGEWDHHAFSDPRTGSYGLRSQPRVNHLLESSLMRGGGASRAVRVCTLPDELTTRTLKHMTGYPTVEHKLTCARTMGLHQVTGSAWTRSPQRQLWYRVPDHASPSHQRNALIVAARLARDLNRTLVLPGTVIRGEPVRFCELFDFVGMRLGSFFTQAEAATAGALFGAGECILPAVAPLQNDTYRGLVRAMSAWDSKPYVCMPFETLAQLVHLPEWAFVCNPSSEAVRSTHVCLKRSKRKIRKKPSMPNVDALSRGGGDRGQRG
jgi:hypothetical protein